MPQIRQRDHRICRALRIDKPRITPDCVLEFHPITLVDKGNFDAQIR